MVTKKIILLFAIGFFSNICIAQNQGDFNITPIIGINYITVGGDGIDSLNQEIKKDTQQYNSIEGISSSGGIYSKIGLNAGFFLDYYFRNNVAFCSGLFYSQKGFILMNSFDLTIGYDYQIKEQIKVNLNYLDFPLLLKYHFNSDIELSAGLLLSFLVSDRVLIESIKTYETADSISGNIITLTEHNSDREDYDNIIDDNEANSLLTGFQIGVSYTFKRLNLSLNLHKNSSFGNIVGIDKNQNIVSQLSIGYQF